MANLMWFLRHVLRNITDKLTTFSTFERWSFLEIPVRINFSFLPTPVMLGRRILWNMRIGMTDIPKRKRNVTFLVSVGLTAALYISPFLSRGVNQSTVGNNVNATQRTNSLGCHCRQSGPLRWRCTMVNAAINHAPHHVGEGYGTWQRIFHSNWLRTSLPSAANGSDSDEAILALRVAYLGIRLESPVLNYFIKMLFLIAVGELTAAWKTLPPTAFIAVKTFSSSILLYSCLPSGIYSFSWQTKNSEIYLSDWVEVTWKGEESTYPSANALVPRGI